MVANNRNVPRVVACQSDTGAVKAAGLLMLPLMNPPSCCVFSSMCITHVPFRNISIVVSFLNFLFQLQLSADVEVVFSRGTVTPEQQKKLPLTQTQDEEHRVDGDLLMLTMILYDYMI